MAQTQNTKDKQLTSGAVQQVVGVVVDVEFAEGTLPAINDALTVQLGDGLLYLEVAQHQATRSSGRFHFRAPMA